MKAHVNLLLSDVLGGEGFPFQQVALPGAFFLLITVILVGSLAEVVRLKSLKMEVARLGERRGQLAQSLAELQSEVQGVLRQGSATTEADEAKLLLWKQLERERIPWSNLLQEMSILIPNGVWLTGMEGLVDSRGENPGGKGSSGGAPGEPVRSIKEVRFVGFADSHAAITQMMLALEGSRHFEKVNLIQAEKKSDATQTSINFEIKGDLKQEGNGG